MIRRRNLLLAIFLLACAGGHSQTPAHGAADDSYLHWTNETADKIGKATSASGRVGSWASYRGLKTERAINYKLKATWFTPEVIRASARNAQLRSRLTDAETKALVAEAEDVKDTVIMVELDPDEGSGVIPSDWEALLLPKGSNVGSALSQHGIENSSLRKIRALQGVTQRNFDYDRFWVVFRLRTADGIPLFSANDKQAQLVVRIRDREGSVTWEIPESIKLQLKEGGEAIAK